MRHATTAPLSLRRLIALCAVLGTAISLLLVAPATAATPASKVPNPWRSEGLEVLGVLPNPWVENSYGEIQYIDEKKQLGYGLILSDGRLGVYDMRTAVPTPVRVSETRVASAAASKYTMAIDRARNRMLIAGRSQTSENRSVIDVIDLKTLTRTATWELSTNLPGYVAMGLRYDKATDRLLLVGEFTASTFIGSVLSSFGQKAVSPGPAVVALDARSGSLLWAAPMRQCHSVLYHVALGSLIARSIHRPALYVFCASGRAASQPVGQNAVLRLDISGERRATGVVEFPTDVFPVSGDYAGTPTATGLVGFDPESERLFAQSLADRTPGVWVFDGLRDSWVGFIAAPNNQNAFLGINPRNGRHYQAGFGPYGTHDGYINIADGRATPVPQGTLFQGLNFNGQITVDGATGRLFAQVAIPAEPFTRLVTLVLRDTTESIDPLAAVDYDALTKDLPDSRADVQYSAASSGFGARYTMVGGWESAYDRIRGPLPALDNPAGRNPADLAYGDRGTLFSAVPSVDIRPSGASATAAAAAADQATASDRNDAETQTGAPDAPLTVLEGGLTCLDGSGKRLERREGEGGPGRARVVCDLAKAAAEGDASYSDDVNGGGQSLGSSSFTTRSFRDPKRGVVTETVAVARGFSLRDPAGAGGLSIDKVTAVSTTVANGRPGTAKVTWKRSVEGAVISGGDGQEERPRSCTTTVVTGRDVRSEGDCVELQRAINRVVTNLQVRFPTPSVTATPRGAFARVEKSEKDFLNGLTTNNDQSHAVPAMETTIFNDGPEKGRLLVQLAAIDGNSILTRSAKYAGSGWGTTTGPGGDTGSEAAGGGTTGSPQGQSGGGAADGVVRAGGGEVLGGSGALGAGADGSDLPPAVALGAEGDLAGSPGVVAQGPLGWLIGARSPREAALAVGIWLLFAGALASMWRRRRLLETVEN